MVDDVWLSRDKSRTCPYRKALYFGRNSCFVVGVQRTKAAFSASSQVGGLGADTRNARGAGMGGRI